jgi:hypothetical protein
MDSVYCARWLGWLTDASHPSSPVLFEWWDRATNSGWPSTSTQIERKQKHTFDRKSNSAKFPTVGLILYIRKLDETNQN